MSDINILVSFNPDLIDKNILARDWAYKAGWQPLSLTAELFAQYIDQGCAFSAQFRDGVRNTGNFKKVGFVAADIDDGMTLAEAEGHPLVKQFATLIYTTPSHRVDGIDRFRIVFATPHVIDDAKLWSFALKGLASVLGSDMAATDGARLFYGSRGSNPRILNNALSEEKLAELIAIGRSLGPRAPDPNPGGQNTSPNAATDRRRVPRSMEIRCSSGTQAVLTDIPPGTTVHCPFHNDTRPSAFVTTSQRGNLGIWCGACNQTYWIEGVPKQTYDFYWFENLAIRKSEELLLKAAEVSPLPTDEWFPPIKPMPVQAKIYNQRFLPTVIQPVGVAFVRSPKGSGKTQSIEAIVRDARRRKKSVLLIGHRRTLIRELSNRLRLKCYLDDVEKGHLQYPLNTADHKAKISKQRPDYYAVSVDSLALRLPSPRKYDIVILDESEQVFSHVCAQTIDNPQPILNVLKHYVAYAPTVYAFDADLNHVTYGFVMRSRGERWADYGWYKNEGVQLVVNRFRESTRACQIYQDRGALVTELIQTAKRGDRVFVACNSKRKAAVLQRVLQRSIKELRTLLVTAESKVESAVLDFLSDVPKEILKYDVIFASPAIGTGIDITFPKDACMVDSVFGFFSPRINTHYDIYQQLGRVRNPGCVKVWVSSEEDYFEIAASVVKRDLVATGKSPIAVTKFDEDGNPEFNKGDPLLSLTVDAYTAQRASQNRLKHFFLEHKRHNGWKVEMVEVEDTDQDADIDLDKVSDEVLRERAIALVKADKIDRALYDEHNGKREDGIAIGVKAGFEASRFEIEDFYGQPISEELVLLDDDGRFRDRVLRFERLYLHVDDMAVQHQLADYWGKASWRDAFPDNVRLLLDALLVSSTLFTAGEFRPRTSISRGDLEPFMVLCRERAISFQEEFRVRLDLRNEVKSLNAVLKLVGLKVVKSHIKKVDGNKVYHYRLDGERLETMVRIVADRKQARLEKSDPEMARHINLYNRRRKERFAREKAEGKPSSDPRTRRG